MKKSLNFLLAGVGGQGTILASDVLVNVGWTAGYQAKQAEVHGMSQRGGSVTSHVRWGEAVHSPLAGAGEINVLLAFEKVEALRSLAQLGPGALAVVNLEAILPVSVTSGGQPYPDDAFLRQAVAQVTRRAAFIDGPGLAASLGSPKVANVILLGALSTLLEEEAFTGPELTVETWLQAIAERVPPRTLELNRRAFLVGRTAVTRPELPVPG
jgi:indolepyruvate ferredoxin oxidoreductase beta subunit